MEIYSKLLIIRLIYSDFILFCQFWLINAKTRWEFRTHSFLFSCFVLFYNAVRFISVLFFLLLFFPISSLHFPSALFSSLLSYSVPDPQSTIFYPQSPIMKIVQIVRFLTSLLQKKIKKNRTEILTTSTTLQWMSSLSLYDFNMMSKVHEQ